MRGDDNWWRGSFAPLQFWNYDRTRSLQYQERALIVATLSDRCAARILLRVIRLWCGGESSVGGRDDPLWLKLFEVGLVLERGDALAELIDFLLFRERVDALQLAAEALPNEIRLTEHFYCVGHV